MMKDKQRTKCEGRSVARAHTSLGQRKTGGRTRERARRWGRRCRSVGRCQSHMCVAGTNFRPLTHSLVIGRRERTDGRTRTVVKVKDGVKAKERASERSVSEGRRRRGASGEKSDPLWRRKEIVSALFHYLCVENSRGDLTLSRPKSARGLHLLLTPDLKDSKLLFG